MASEAHRHRAILAQAGESASRQQVADLQRDNGILKRAVAIQNARLQARIFGAPCASHVGMHLSSMMSDRHAVVTVVRRTPARAERTSSCCPSHKATSFRAHSLVVCLHGRPSQHQHQLMGGCCDAMQEAASREAEVQALRGQLKQAAERVSALELSNYSLAQHLRAATTAAHDFGGPRDVC